MGGGKDYKKARERELEPESNKSSGAAAYLISIAIIFFTS